MHRAIRIGTAGWTISSKVAEAFPAAGTHLERYAQRFRAVEINSSFYRPHRPSTYARWAAAVPADFRFAVKLPKSITHEHRLADPEPALSRFLAEIGALGGKLGPLLVQLPPSLAYDDDVAAAFFGHLRDVFLGQLICEPRHPTWFADYVEERLARFEISRVAADPAVVPRAAEPGGWPSLTYYRLHGSPRMYYSGYEAEYLDLLAERIRQADMRASEVWCIFDNTALGAAVRDALSLAQRLRERLTTAGPVA